MTITTSPGVANFVMRGMGTVGQSIPSADPAVGVVMDGISYGTIYGVVTDLFDLEAIEILRGPQGTLFGRNVTDEEKEAEVGLIGDPNAVGDCASQSAPFETHASLDDCQPAFEDDEHWSKCPRKNV